MKLSPWQDGVPPCDGIWEIFVEEYDCNFYARYKAEKWGSGHVFWCDPDLALAGFIPYPPNNDPLLPRKWRGIIDE